MTDAADVDHESEHIKKLQHENLELQTQLNRQKRDAKREADKLESDNKALKEEIDRLKSSQTASASRSLSPQYLPSPPTDMPPKLPAAVSPPGISHDSEPMPKSKAKAKNYMPTAKSSHTAVHATSSTRSGGVPKNKKTGPSAAAKTIASVFSSKSDDDDARARHLEDAFKREIEEKQRQQQQEQEQQRQLELYQKQAEVLSKCDDKKFTGTYSDCPIEQETVWKLYDLQAISPFDIDAIQSYIQDGAILPHREILRAIKLYQAGKYKHIRTKGLVGRLLRSDDKSTIIYFSDHVDDNKMVLATFFTIELYKRLSERVLEGLLRDDDDLDDYKDQITQHVYNCMFAQIPELQYEAALRCLGNGETMKAFKIRFKKERGGKAVCNEKSLGEDWDTAVDALASVPQFENACIEWAEGEPVQQVYCWPPTFRDPLVLRHTSLNPTEDEGRANFADNVKSLDQLTEAKMDGLTKLMSTKEIDDAKKVDPHANLETAFNQTKCEFVS